MAIKVMKGNDLQQKSLELQDVTMNMNTDVECKKATNFELKLMLVLFNASYEWQ